MKEPVFPNVREIGKDATNLYIAAMSIRCALNSDGMLDKNASTKPLEDFCKERMEGIVTRVRGNRRDNASASWEDVRYMMEGVLKECLEILDGTIQLPGEWATKGDDK